MTPEVIAENRRKGVEALRTTDLPQGGGQFYNAIAGCYCALGILALAVGLDPIGDPWLATEKAYGIGYGLGRKDGDGSYAISSLSDMGMTFSEMGDRLAGIWGIG